MAINLPGKISVFFLFILVFCSPPSVASAATRILILHSYHVGLDWTDGVMEGMQKVLKSRPDIHIDVEYMDTKRHHDPEYLFRVVETLLTHKLRNFSYDLILLSDNDALAFAMRHRNDLFAGTPIVFCGINNFEQKMIAGMKGVTGVAEYPNFKDTIALALRFHPSARQIVVIGNTRNETDRQNAALLRTAASGFPGRVRFLYWDDLPIDSLVPRLSRLGRESIVFINGLITDRAGRTIPFHDSNRRIRLACPAPLYSLWDFFLGEGIVGGRLVSSHRQGELGAQIALRVLDGADPDRIPVVTRGTNEYMFDFRELERFGIPLKALPAGSRVINQPRPFLPLTKVDVWVIGSFALLLVGIAGVLLWAMIRQRRAETALRESEERFRAIADYTHDMEVWTGTDGRLKWINPSSERLTGYTPGEILAMHDFPRPFLLPENADEVMRVYAHALETRTSGNDYPFRFRRRDGEERWIAVSWQPIFSRRGEWLGMRSSLRDITERKAAEAHLRELNEELDAFVRTVSHDLRGQLTPVIGFAEFLQKEYGGRLDVTAREALSEIAKGARRMHANLEDLLALARVGYLEAPSQPVDSKTIAREVLLSLTPRMAEKGVRVELTEMPPVRIPSLYLQQALENLLGNAIRYGAPKGGSIEVGGVRRRGRTSFYVRDHGPGVPDPEKERIFELFYRGEQGRDVSGTGVGLATVRRIARRCGGKAWVEDTPGGGATFWLEVESQGDRHGLNPDFND